MKAADCTFCVAAKHWFIQWEPTVFWMGCPETSCPQTSIREFLTSRTPSLYKMKFIRASCSGEHFLWRVPFYRGYTNSWNHHAFTSPKAWNDLVLTFDDSTLLEILLLSSPLSLSLSLWLFRDVLLDAKTWCCVSFNYNFNVWMPPYCPQLGNWCQFTRLHWPSRGSGFQSPTVALNKLWRQESLPPVSTTSLLLLT